MKKKEEAADFYYSFCLGYINIGWTNIVFKGKWIKLMSLGSNRKCEMNFMWFCVKLAVIFVVL